MGKVESFNCVKCRVLYKQNLYRHKLKFVKLISYESKQCSKKFTRKYSLIDHQKNAKTR